MTEFQKELKQKFKEQLNNFNSNDLDDYNLIRFSLDELNLFEILDNYNLSNCVYYKNQSKQFLIIDYLNSFSLFSDESENKKVHSEIQNILNKGIEIFYYSKFDSNSQKDDLWNNFDDNQIIFPRLKITKIYDDFFAEFVFNKNEFENLEELLEQSLNFDFSSPKPSLPKVSSKSYFPDKDQWVKNLENAKDLFNQGKFSKIVQARKHSIEFDSKLDSVSILKKLTEVNSESFCFLIRSDNSDFIGASPEKLFTRYGSLLTSDALAGTRKKSENKEENAIIAFELISNQKELTEQQIVKDEIVARLEHISKKVEVTDLRVKELKYLMHLHNSINAKLDEDITDFDIIESLHPTPAVGSLPNDKSIIHTIEKWERGLYAGPIGFVSKDHSEIIVAIRSALIQDNFLTIFSGAGIIPDSDPEKEWEEINHKMNNFIKILENDFN